MRDLALHVLDVAENSLRAGASRLVVRLTAEPERDLLVLEIEDDGRGMDEAEQKKAVSPFYTGRAGRRFGLGLPLLAQAAEATGGRFVLFSAPGRGTRVRAEFHPSHIDMKPVGDLEGTLVGLQTTHPEIEVVFESNLS